LDTGDSLLASQGGKRYSTRYYSPEAKVPFCGDPTIASGVVLGETRGLGTYQLLTAIGKVGGEVSAEGGVTRAALTSVEPSHEDPAPGMVDAALAALGWKPPNWMTVSARPWDMPGPDT